MEIYSETLSQTLVRCVTEFIVKDYPHLTVCGSDVEKNYFVGDEATAEKHRLRFGGVYEKLNKESETENVKEFINCGFLLNLYIVGTFPGQETK